MMRIIAIVVAIVAGVLALVFGWLYRDEVKQGVQAAGSKSKALYLRTKAKLPTWKELKAKAKGLCKRKPKGQMSLPLSTPKA